MKTKERKDTKKGISLIVLVITIIVIIILAVAVILNIANNNPIDNARRATKEWNEATIREYIRVLLVEHEGSDKNLADFLKEKVESGAIDGLQGEDETSLSVIIAIGDTRTGVWKDTKEVIGITNQNVLDKIQKFKDELATNKSSIISDMVSGDNVKDYIPSYEGTNYKFAIMAKDYLMYEDNDSMTKEEKMACEMMGIYLLGDTNRDYELDSKDINIINDKVAKRIDITTEREKKTADTDGIDGINSSDSIYIQFQIEIKYNNYIENIKKEFDENIAKEGENKVNISTDNYNEIKKYIPSHTDTSYDFIIKKGRLLVPLTSKMEDLKKIICDSNDIYVLGDANFDGTVSKSDKLVLQKYLAGKYNVNDEELEKFNIVVDLDDNGKITEEDLKLLQSVTN